MIRVIAQGGIRVADGTDVRARPEKAPADLTLEEVLSVVVVGEHSSSYEHEIPEKVEARYDGVVGAGDARRFVDEWAWSLPGYDSAAREAVYRARGIGEAVVLSLIQGGRFSCPAVALYRVEEHRSWGERPDAGGDRV